MRGLSLFLCLNEPQLHNPRAARARRTGDFRVRLEIVSSRAPKHLLFGAIALASRAVFTSPIFIT